MDLHFLPEGDPLQPVLVGTQRPLPEYRVAYRYLADWLKNTSVVLLTKSGQTLASVLGAHLPGYLVREVGINPAVRRAAIRKERENAANRVRGLCKPAGCGPLRRLELLLTRKDDEFGALTRTNMMRAISLIETYGVHSVAIEEFQSTYRRIGHNHEFGEEDGRPLQDWIREYGSPGGSPNYQPQRRRFVHELQLDHTVHRDLWPAPLIPQAERVLMERVRVRLAGFVPTKQCWQVTPVLEPAAAAQTVVKLMGKTTPNFALPDWGRRKDWLEPTVGTGADSGDSDGSESVVALGGSPTTRGRRGGASSVASAESDRPLGAVGGRIGAKLGGRPEGVEVLATPREKSRRGGTARKKR